MAAARLSGAAILSILCATLWGWFCESALPTLRIPRKRPPRGPGRGNRRPRHRAKQGTLSRAGIPRCGCVSGRAKGQKGN